ncbi:MAG TPA: glycosyltransferase [Mycobacteriales bacterium]|nr:glycosyltransferase [Mycobacteriales bacterium]
MGVRLGCVWQSAAVQESGVAAVTVVVPTRDRPQQLAACLASVRGALRPGDELVVVDSASTDGDAVAAVATGAAARVVRCPLPGVNRARNAGWRAGRHSVVLFTDDDVVVDAGWRDALAAAVTAGEDIGFVTGRVLPPDGEQPSRDVAIKRDDLPATYDATSVGNLGHGASLAIRRPVLDRIGGWDESMGTGGRFGAAPEHDLFDRCFAAGYAGRYEPKALAWHAQWRGPRRLLLLDLRYGYGAGARLAKLWRLDRRRARLVTADYFGGSGRELMRELRAGQGYPALGTFLRLVAMPVGLLRALFVPIDDGHYRARE